MPPNSHVEVATPKRETELLDIPKIAFDAAFDEVERAPGSVPILRIQKKMSYG